MIRRPPWLTYAFAAVTLASVCGHNFLKFLSPDASDWLLWLLLTCIAIALPWLIICAFIRKPRSAPILLATLLIIYVPSLVDSENANWPLALGFRIHASPVERYLAECEKLEFTENGATKVIGLCDGREVGSALNSALELVIYDPAGEILKSDEQRSPEWTQAFQSLVNSDGGFVIRGWPRRLFGDFYLIYLGLKSSSK